MPLLYGKPFCKEKPPANLSDNDEVFYCESTNEIFTDYENFAKRVIQCNSLVWSCALTGKNNVTYQEALLSEREARRTLKEFPPELKIPVLYIASLTNRCSFRELAEDVFMYIRDRYFTGEIIDVCFDGSTWCECYILQVVPPDEELVNKLQENAEIRETFYPSHVYMYEVQKLDGVEENPDQCTIVSAIKVKRKKGLYTKVKSSLFLKQHTEQTSSGLWVVSPKSREMFGLHKMKFDAIFSGPAPEFPISKRLKKLVQIKANNLKQSEKKKRIEDYLVPVKKNSGDISPSKLQGNLVKKYSTSKLTNDLNLSPHKQIAKKLKQKYKDAATLKHRKVLGGKVGKGLDNRLSKVRRLSKTQRALLEKEEKKKVKEKNKEEKKRVDELMKEWNRRREDLECEDLKPLPATIPVQCKIPNEHFGDFIMVLEFFHNFKNQLNTRHFFPGGITFEAVERALTEVEISGPLNDLIMLLLCTLFNMQDEEDDEISETDIASTADADTEDMGDITTSEAVKFATIAANWCQMYLGTPVQKLPLDSATVSEVLRLHLLSSGGRSGETSAKWRYQQRGGYRSLDDPGLLLHIHDSHILRKLSTCDICELSIEDKLKILSCLINQILTYAVMRDLIDERGEKMKQAKSELRAFQIAKIKKEKEAATMRKLAKKEAKLKGVPVSTIIANDGKEIEDKEARLQLHSNQDKGGKKNEFDKLIRNFHKAALCYQVLPLGSDRAHRRYWLFGSLPGFFVEQDRVSAGACLPNPTPHNPALVGAADSVMYVRKLFAEELNGGSDKENETAESHKLSKSLSSDNRNVCSRISESDQSETSKSQLLICTADENCTVHSKSLANCEWSFFNSEDDVENLVSCLNKRGIRENDLRHCVQQRLQIIKESISQCPIQKLNLYLQEVQESVEVRRSSRALGTKTGDDRFPSDMPISERLECTLIDDILNIEEKVVLGRLGHLKVLDRDPWRQCLEDRNYEKIFTVLEKETKETGQKFIDKLRSEEGASRPDTPASEVSYKDPGRHLVSANQQDSPSQQLAHKALALAILQLAQSLESRYLQKPLGGEENNELMERWETSLLACTSFSQLFLHLCILDNSIHWSKATANRCCKVCRYKGEVDNMAYCNDCGKGFHLRCLQPKLHTKPEGDWWCPVCKPPQKKPAEKKKRQIFTEDSEEEETTKKPVAKVIIHKKLCEACSDSGDLVACSGCPVVFHIECMQPALRNPPRGRWYCNKCKGKKETYIHKDIPVGRQQRTCATAAVAKISMFTKQLLCNTWSEEENSNQGTEPAPSRRSARHSLEADLDLPLNNALLQDLLKDVMHHKDAWPFLRPVIKAEAPDYHQIIKRPMDFGTMKYKLNMLEYLNNSEFIADGLLIFENCCMYNQEEAPEYKAGQRLRKFFEKRCRELGLKFRDEDLQQPNAKRPRLSF